MTSTPTSTPATTPVTVIGGFLGAGKTTFLNRLLTSGGRYAVLVNDFGEINIDAGLIARHDGTTMALSNGCVCCSIGGGFLETLGALLDSGAAFDHIVIEASGVGDPWRIAEIALVEPSLRLHLVVVMADASRLPELLQDARIGDTVRGQFARAHLVLLTRADVTDPATQDAAMAAIARLRPDLPVVPCTPDTLPQLAELDTLAASAPRGGAFRAEPAEAARHEADFRRFTYRRSGGFDRGALATALAALPSSLLRLKGQCRLAGEVAPALLQFASADWSLAPVDDGLDPSHDIVLVGVGTADLPPADDLARILDGALAPARATGEPGLCHA
jgi:G3E family GTPase